MNVLWSPYVGSLHLKCSQGRCTSAEWPFTLSQNVEIKRGRGMGEWQSPIFKSTLGSRCDIRLTSFVNISAQLANDNLLRICNPTIRLKGVNVFANNIEGLVSQGLLNTFMENVKLGQTWSLSLMATVIWYRCKTFQMTWCNIVDVRHGKVITLYRRDTLSRGLKGANF